MVVAPLLASTFLAVAGITTASLLMLVTVYAIYRNFNSPPLSSTTSFLKEERAENHYSQFEDSSSSTLSQKSETAPHTQNQSFNYYHREFFSEKLTGNQQQDKTFLSKEIDNKILSLQQQIENSKKTLSEYLWSQKPKRLDKIKSLEGFKKVLNSDNCQITPLSRRASQSFFKETGKLEEFSQAMERYIQLHSSS